MLIVVLLIGLMAAMLTPKLLQAREEAYRQTARQQVKVFEQALGQWYNSQASLAAASATWVTWDANEGTSNDGYASAADVLTAIRPYLSLQKMPTATKKSLYTAEMASIPLKNSYIGGATGSDSVGFAHIRFYWSPNSRSGYAPQVVFFLPSN